MSYSSDAAIRHLRDAYVHLSEVELLFRTYGESAEYKDRLQTIIRKTTYLWDDMKEKYESGGRK